MLRFNNGITSAGAALTDPACGKSYRVRRRTLHGSGCCDALPSVREQFRAARATLPFVARAARGLPLPRSGRRQVGAAALGRGRDRSAALDWFPAHPARHRTVARRSRNHRAGSRAAGGARATTRARRNTELDVTEQLVGSALRVMADPALFKRLSLLYFAAASYSETVRRLARPHLAPGFLLNEHPQFGVEVRDCAGPRCRCAARHGPGRAFRAHRSRHRAVRYGRAPRPHAPRLVSGTGLTIWCPVPRSSRRRLRTSSACWCGAGW